MPAIPGRWLTILGAGVGVAYALVWSWALSSQTYNIYGAMAIIPIIVAINLLLIARVLRSATEPWLPWVLIVGFFLKMVGTFARYYVAYVVYSGSADAERYNVYASYQHQVWRRGDIVWDAAGKQGTQVMELITTAVYTFIGGSPLAGFFVFASFAFWGSYLLYRAFCIAVPNADLKRYALLIFLMPSMLYWPSSIGKESWLFLFVGVTAYGAARHFTERGGAMWLLALGGLGMGLVRPHVAVLMVAAIFVAQLFRPTGGTASGILRKLGGIVVLGVAALILVRSSAQFLGIDDISAQAVTETIDYRSDLTGQGGSEFTPVPLTDFFGIPMAFITWLFRPFPFEASNFQMLVQSLEGVLILALAVLGWRRLKQLPRLLIRNPFVVFAVVFFVAYVLAFAGFGNFGILARQRVLILPFVFMLLSLPKPVSTVLDNLPTRSGTARSLPGATQPLVMSRR